MTYQASTTESICLPNSEQCISSWAHDSAGRMDSQIAPYPPASVTPPPTNTTTARTYDAENHLQSTQFRDGASSNWTTEVVQWGPDGHPIKIGTYAGTNQQNEQDERLHWNGNQLLFTTH